MAIPEDGTATLSGFRHRSLRLGIGLLALVRDDLNVTRPFGLEQKVITHASNVNTCGAFAPPEKEDADPKESEDDQSETAYDPMIYVLAHSPSLKTKDPPELFWLKVKNMTLSLC